MERHELANLLTEAKTEEAFDAAIRTLIATTSGTAWLGDAATTESWFIITMDKGSFLAVTRLDVPEVWLRPRAEEPVTPRTGVSGYVFFDGPQAMGLMPLAKAFEFLSNTTPTAALRCAEIRDGAAQYLWTNMQLLKNTLHHKLLNTPDGR